MTAHHTPTADGRIEAEYQSWSFLGFQLPARASQTARNNFSSAPMREPDAASAKRHRRDKLDFVLIYAFAYVVLLFAALLQRVLPRKMRSFPCEQGVRQSIFAEARRATRNIMPFAFMG